MRVLGRVPVPGKVLGTGRDAGALEPTHESCHVPRDHLPVGAERADADHGILRIRVDVGHGSKVEVDAGLGELRPERCRDAVGELDVVDRAQRAVARIRAAAGRLEPCDVAAFLVDRDEHMLALCTEVRRQRTQLVATLDIPGVQDHSAEPVREPPTHPVGDARALEARKDAGRGEPLELRTHALTAPAVSPKAIFRCTSRKKITTGIAVSVEAAISPPQSMFRLVP